MSDKCEMISVRVFLFLNFLEWRIKIFMFIDDLSDF